jgi:hypothetical protein
MAKSSSNPEGNPEDGPVVNVGEPIPKRYFNCIMHEEVQMLRKRGIWCNFGERYNGLKIRILGGLHSEVISAQTREENKEKQRKFGGLTGDLDPEDSFAANRRAAPARISGVQGDLLVTGEMAAIATRHGIPVVTDPEGNRFISFTGSEDKRAVQEIMRPMVQVSDALFTGLFNTSENLKKVTDEEIHKMGEAYVYGDVEADG